jgi:glucose-6-phosphate 1-epimerase
LLFQDLNARFAIPGVLLIGPGHGGLACVNVTSPLASACIYLHGAQVTSFSPTGESELLFMSEKSVFAAGKAIRGGVPICFPWFGAGADAAHPLAPAHGVARLIDWTLAGTRLRDDGAVEITLRLPPDAAHPATADVIYTVVIADTLDVRLTVRNPGTSDFFFEAALHSYLAVADVRQISITGLEGQTYLNQLDGTQQTQNGAIHFTAETDRIYEDSTSICVVHDPVLHRQITVEKIGSHSTVVWNPWIGKAQAMKDFGDDEWPAMVCVETAAVRKNGVTVGAGGSHTIGTRLSVRR